MLAYRASAYTSHMKPNPKTVNQAHLARLIREAERKGIRVTVKKGQGK